MSSAWAVGALVMLVACGHAAPAPVVPRVVQLNAPGALVDLDAAVPLGHVTIVDFWATWCGGCKIAEARFMADLGETPGYVVRKVDVGDGDTPAAKTFHVRGLPQIWIYDRARQLRYVLVANDTMRVAEVVRELLAEAPR
ncbi:MAG: thioredoxin family protein [Deltaproteobacteria bacterium]|nr:thioredoxin family protein [Deltaproteobacteria bacterium]